MVVADAAMTTIGMIAAAAADEMMTIAIMTAMMIVIDVAAAAVAAVNVAAGNLCKRATERPPLVFITGGLMDS